MQRDRSMKKHRIESRLLQRRAELMARYHDELALAAEELDTREIEMIDNANELWDARVLSALSHVDRHALQRIVAALRRLEEGTYGTCLECGIAIESARLFALPEAATCIDCAVDIERPHDRVAS